jgi:hypothetical protein
MALQLPEIAWPLRAEPAELMRSADCGVARHTDPTVTKNGKLAPPHFPAFNRAGRTFR